MGHARLEMFIRHSVGRVETDTLIQSSGERSGMKEKLWKLSFMNTVFKGVKLMQSNKYDYRQFKVLALGHFMGLGEEKLVEEGKSWKEKPLK